MLKRILIIMSAGVFIFGISKLSFAESATQAGSSEQVQKAENVGNKICPVTGEKIDEKTKVTYEYQGKIYNFCCAGCPDEFKKDPQKYIKKVEEELQAQPKNAAQEETMRGDEMHEGMHEGQH